MRHMSDVSTWTDDPRRMVAAVALLVTTPNMRAKLEERNRRISEQVAAARRVPVCMESCPTT